MSSLLWTALAGVLCCSRARGYDLDGSLFFKTLACFVSRRFAQSVSMLSARVFAMQEVSVGNARARERMPEPHELALFVASFAPVSVGSAAPARR